MAEQIVYFAIRIVYVATNRPPGAKGVTPLAEVIHQSDPMIHWIFGGGGWRLFILDCYA